MKKKISDFIKKNDSLLLIISTILIELILYFLKVEDYGMEIVTLLLIGALGVIFIIYRKTKNKKYIFYMIYFLGMFIRTIYIMKTNIYTRQHDVETLLGNGHLKYIYTLYSTGKLPDINDWQLYHPPLWHIIGAIWLKFTDLFHVEQSMAFEGIQIWSLLFSTGLIIVTDKILKKLNLTYTWRYLIDLLIAVHPSLIIFSGSINNDCLLIFLQALIILELIIWYDDDSYKNMIILAITTGLCVMTKANGAIMAIPILYVFVRKFLKLHDKKKIIRFLGQLGLFLIISLPIGLWFQVRSIILFKSIKVPKPGEWLNLKDVPLIKRLFFFHINDFLHFVDTNKDHNIIALIIKTTVFGEFSHEKIIFIPPLLLITNIVLIIIGLIQIVAYVFKKPKNMILDILIITWITSLIAMLLFNIKYPYICTANFRYMAITLLPGLIIPIYMLKDKKDSFFRDAIVILSIIFVAASTLFAYLL